MQSVFAQSITIGGSNIQGPLSGINSLADVINKLLQFLIPFGAIILFFVLVWGGYDYIISRGDPEKIKTARAKFTTGIIGFILLIASYAVVRVLAEVFGLGKGIF